MRWIVREVERRDTGLYTIARTQNITERWAREVHKRFRNREPELLSCGRKPRLLSEEERKLVKQAYKKFHVGATAIEQILDEQGKHINHNRIHRIMLEEGLAKKEPKKSRRRKWVRYERKHSLSLKHGDWFDHKGKHCLLIIDYAIAMIAQEQVVKPMMRGTVQLEEDKAVIESWESKMFKPHIHEVDYDFLNKDCSFRSMKPLDYIAEGHNYLLMNLARGAKKALGLEGIVQVEFCLSPERIPDLVQIRKLPERASLTKELNLDVPDGVPMLESRVCNGVAGDLVLPAYVTVSPFGIQGILAPNGQAFFMGMGFGLPREGDDRSEKFEEKSKLASNPDFVSIRELKQAQHFDQDRIFQKYDEIWIKGNNLFKNYILVYDRLDESCDGMNRYTTNKRAIITCGDESKTSHAMTVARELEIMCMGVYGEMSDLDYFFHQVETGDLVHMKSDGNRAVAYVEKKREKDPYPQSV